MMDSGPMHIASDVAQLDDLREEVRALRTALEEEHRARVRAERRYADLADACQGVLDELATPAFRGDR